MLISRLSSSTSFSTFPVGFPFSTSPSSNTSRFASTYAGYTMFSPVVRRVAPHRALWIGLHSTRQKRAPSGMQRWS
ncbi:hypothetical protein MSAN_00007100 [Mycena sanguinolenta]|uniref:Uncharacterized protein n=1 Tax=Mycena sanguinolenta TaxID=230812 RepID=A0A8H7DJS6_9AGAR|nr:hypothetical protein MSAN_00007100 [Mycena sanguinolenta]